MTGGAFRNNSNLLGRNREIEELEELISKSETEDKGKPQPSGGYQDSTESARENDIEDQ